ncbi:MAG: hypothetical protein R8M45_00250 [Ghiorsea sp.]
MSVALARAAAELGVTAHDSQIVDLVTVYRPALTLGQLIEVHDYSQVGSWKGKVTGIRHNASSGTLQSTLKVERLNV